MIRRSLRPSRRPAARPRRSDDGVLPLINVVFLLLIFFMLAGRLAAVDPFPLTPPRSAAAGAQEQAALLVQIGADGRLALDGEVMDEEALHRAVAERIRDARTDMEDGDDPAEPDLRIKADGAAPTVRVVEVMNLLRRAGVERLTLLTRAEDA